MPELLSTRDLRKHFGGIRAVDGVSLAVQAGALHGIIGPNGSGKTTVFNIISGIYKPDAGEVFFDGQPIGGRPAQAIVRRGVARTFQNLRLFRSMTVIENVEVGLGGFRRAGGAPAAAREHAVALLERVGLARDGDVLATALPYGKQRKVEIARALATGPRLLLLDEPAAGLNSDEKRELDTFLQSLVSGGLSVVMIEHDMRLVMGVCSTVTVLDRGTVIANGTPSAVRSDSRVIAAYLGDEST